MTWKLTSAEPLYPVLSKTKLASMIDELECNPKSSKLNLINPYWSVEDEEPTVMFSSLPMFAFLATPFESTKVSSIVLSANPRSSNPKDILPYPSTSVTLCPGKWKCPVSQLPMVSVESIVRIR